MKRITIFCPAKINLFLNIIGKQGNMHLLKMLNQTVSLFDVISLEINNSSDINITCSDKNIPTDIKNSVFKAVLLMKKKYNINYGFNIFIEKNIPIGAGLGGESTDAAGIILGINKICKLNLTKKELISIGQDVGSDVPFCIMGGTKIVQSLGEKITNYKTEYNYFLIIKPKFNTSTKDMFIKYDGKNDSYKEYDITIGHNDFESIISVNNIKNDLLKNGAVISNMTGSGSAVIGIFKDFNSQKMAYNILKEKYEIYLVSSCSGIIIKM